MFEHGGDIAAYEKELGISFRKSGSGLSSQSRQRGLDFSASISPLPMSEKAVQAAMLSLSESTAYPDPYCRALRSVLSGHLKVPADQILCGGGASDLIYRLAAAKKPKKALVISPCFGEYEAALKLVGCRAERYVLSEEHDFRLTEEFLTRIDDSIQMVFLAQPNNPTGLTIPPLLLKKIHKRCQKHGVFLVLDECFIEFLDQPQQYTLLTALQSDAGADPSRQGSSPEERSCGKRSSGKRNSEEKGQEERNLEKRSQENGSLMILRAFTKFYGMAGLRLGYCICQDLSLLEQMRLQGPPWPVSTPAQEAGVAALEDQDYARRLHSLIKKERRSLSDTLTSLGLRVIPGEANFLLFQSTADLGKQLKKQGVVLRCCADFAGLGPDWYRTAVRTPEENRVLILAIQEILT